MAMTIPVFPASNMRRCARLWRPYVYVANRLGHSLSVIRNTEFITTIEARGNPRDIGVDEERGYSNTSMSELFARIALQRTEQVKRVLVESGANIRADGWVDDH